MSSNNFDSAVASYREALGDFVAGDPGRVMQLFSARADVTLANPLGPPRRGPAEVERAIRAAAANFSGGSVHFQEVSRYATPDLGYVVQMEVSDVRLSGKADLARSTLRVTMIFRREEDSWKVAHRHADRITTDQPIDTILD